MSKKATELGQRLQNCRTIVKNWEERETNKRRAWRGVWVGALWGLALIAIAILAGIASWKAIEIHSDHGTAQGQLQHITVHNKSLDLDVLQNLSIPEDVKEVLIDIDDRARQRRSNNPVSSTPMGTAPEDTKLKAEQDRSFRMLDEL